MVTRIASALGAVGTLVSTVANLGCCGLGISGAPRFLAPVASALTPLGAAWGYEALYGSLAVLLAALAARAWISRHPAPLILGLAGAAALLMAFHEAWDVRTFAVLVGSGGAALSVAAVWGIRSRACASASLLARAH